MFRQFFWCCGKMAVRLMLIAVTLFLLLCMNVFMGSGDGGTYSTIRELEPGATVLEGLPVEMTDAENGPTRSVAAWLKSLGIE